MIVLLSGASSFHTDYFHFPLAPMAKGASVSSQK